LLRDAPDVTPLTPPNYPGMPMQTDPSVVRRPLTAACGARSSMPTTASVRWWWSRHRLTLSSNLGEPVTLTTKVHFLTAVRSAADRVEIQHGAVAR